MLNWKSEFDAKILKRGGECFREGSVVGLHREKDVWKAFSVGTDIYRTRVGVSADGLHSASCNCPYAKENERCKHMAALLFALEEQGLGVMADDDAALSERAEDLSRETVEDLLQLAIAVNSPRCTAVLLNCKLAQGAPVYSPDEFTLDDLPKDLKTEEIPDVQGKNDPMSLLFPEQEKSV